MSDHSFGLQTLSLLMNDLGHSEVWITAGKNKMPWSLKHGRTSYSLHFKLKQQVLVFFQKLPALDILLDMCLILVS